MLEGKDVTVMGTRELNEIRSNFGVVFQGVAPFDSMTVFENVALPLKKRPSSARQEIRKRVMESLEQLGLVGHEDKFPAQIEWRYAEKGWSGTCITASAQDHAV